jgi:hypothetical protein
MAHARMDCPICDCILFLSCTAALGNCFLRRRIDEVSDVAFRRSRLGMSAIAD